MTKSKKDDYLCALSGSYEKVSPEGAQALNQERQRYWETTLKNPPAAKQEWLTFTLQKNIPARMQEQCRDKVVSLYVDIAPLIRQLHVVSLEFPDYKTTPSDTYIALLEKAVHIRLHAEEIIKAVEQCATHFIAAPKPVLERYNKLFGLLKEMRTEIEGLRGEVSRNFGVAAPPFPEKSPIVGRSDTAPAAARELPWKEHLDKNPVVSSPLGQRRASMSAMGK